MSSIKLDKRVHGLLVDIYMLGARCGMRLNTGVLVAMLQAVSAPSAAFACAQAQLALRLGDRGTAQQLLEEADRAFPDTPLVKAQLALTLAIQGNAQWHAYMHELEALAQDEVTHSVVRLIRRVTEPGAEEEEHFEPLPEPKPVAEADLQAAPMLLQDAAVPMGRPC